LIYCGEWIESHVLHMYMLHAPDFLGYESSIHLAQDHPDVVERALKMKKVGNDLLTLVLGRETHPINVRVGGFYKVPTKRDLASMVEPLEWARDEALETVRWTSTLEFPDFEQDYEVVSLRHPDEYPFNEGRIVSNRGVDIDVAEFGNHFVEEHVPHSTALHSRRKGYGPYMVGPIARYNLNGDRLSPLAREAASDAGIGNEVRNPFKSIIIRAIETLYALDEALRIIKHYEMPDRPAIYVEPRHATGHGCTEAPRGSLYHRYTIDEGGTILDAEIVPPTAQNQPTIESDLYHFVDRYKTLPDDRLTWQCEQAIRNYDPCISCSTHFLRLHVDRR
jgi:coenzyme F420-reducing hydrogenase alpha subunit